MGSSSRRLLSIALLAIGLAVGAGAANAAIVTLTGTLFDVQYDDVQLNPSSGQFSLFGAPLLFGSNIVFRPNNLFAQSMAQGLVTVAATFNLAIIAKAGTQVSGLSLTELGDLTMRQNGSSVNVGGQLIAFDAGNMASYTTSNLALLSPTNFNNTVSTPPNVQNANWIAQAAISGSANPTPFANPAGTFVILENQLQATTPSNDPNSFAFIQKKVAGDAVTLTVLTTPIPGAGLLLASGLAGMLGFHLRRRRSVAAVA